MGRISITCTHTNVIKKCIFYITNLTDTKVILGLNFCRAFNLVTVNCDEHCMCQKIAVDVINEFSRGLDIPNQRDTKPPPPVDAELKLRPDCEAHIMELFPNLFDGVGTIKDAVSSLISTNLSHQSFSLPGRYHKLWSSH